MKFFFYGIFLDRRTRLAYGISSEPKYASVEGYVTRGQHIVEAIAVPEKLGMALTGITVDVPEAEIRHIDNLERGYERVTITTTGGEKAQMYRGG